MRHVICILILVASIGGPAFASDHAAPAKAPEPPPTPKLVAVCDLIKGAATKYDLPLPYFTRLIWRESRFHLDALSPAGAQGIAQFMPGTAADRGLVDPFAADAALLQSAAYLADLRATTGNLGLAAAAYNAGPGRVGQWLAGQSFLPQETLDYVLAVTGREADAWKADPKPVLPDEKDFSCETFAARAGSARVALSASGSSVPRKPWAVILVGNPQRARVVSEYAMVRGRFSAILGGVQPAIVYRRISGALVPRFIVQVERDTRAAADSLCSKLLRAGGACFVLASGS